MKLRTRKNSIRLRLGQSEVAELAEKGELVETIAFAPGSTLSYAIAVDPDATRVRASFSSGVLRVTAPRALVHAWASSDEVGFEDSQETGGPPLAILVEKDWACLRPRAGEDDADAYPNPSGSC